MPIGASKVGALGGLVPGGTETFNAPGTFSIPPGVKKVSITGRGGTGNPGVAGNPGNPGNSGSGGGGGGGGSGGSVGSAGGVAFNPGDALTNANFGNRQVAGGNNNLPGTTGTSGSAGSAGSAGNPGNPGQDSSGLGNTFPGGAGGNAGVGGAAGNAGGGGPGGSGGLPGPASCIPGLGGCGGTGGGQGARGFGLGNPIPGPITSKFGGRGGGGASANVDGFPAYFPGNTNTPNPSFPTTFNSPSIVLNSAFSGAGGPDPSIAGNLPTAYSGPVTGSRSPNKVTPTCPVGRFYYGPAQSPTSNNPEWLKRAGGTGGSPCGGRAVGVTCFIGLPNPTFGPGPAPQSNWWRAGGGGGQGGPTSPSGEPLCNPSGNQPAGGGGGGGGRGSVGNAGGPAPTPSGSTATPATFNCVPVTPGGTAPITVASPGGQIVISWNPQ